MKSYNKPEKVREETVELSGILDKDLFNVACAIQRSSSWIHKNCLRGGGQFLIVEGAVAKELVTNQPGYTNGILSNRWQTVFISDGVYRNCITVVRRGEFAKFVVLKPKRGDGLNIPVISIRTAVKRQKDFVSTIYIQKGVIENEEQVQDPVLSTAQRLSPRVAA